MDKQNTSNLTTEQRNPNTMDLDLMSPLEIVTVMNQEDHTVADAVAKCLPAIAKAAQMAAEAFQKGGRMLYVGAGTSGRLGVLDASECPPTFGVHEGMVIGVIAGGNDAITHAVEGAEDDAEKAVNDLKDYSLNENDLVAGIAASGRTSYVYSALQYAKSIGCATVSIACNKNALISEVADCAIEAVTGPEVLTGSTRLKAGTATKMILNMISTAAMVQCGKVYENLMVDVVQSNQKLQRRALRIVMSAAGVDVQEASATLEKAGGNCKKAIVMLKEKCTLAEAEEILQKNGGHIRLERE